MKTLTVFTPAYNRAHTLGRTYDSLCRQDCHDFKWLIIDDGSTDKTRELCSGWINDGIIEVEYVRKENGGLHTCYNKAAELADTELCICIDSDDYMPDGCVSRIISFWRENGSPRFAGIIALDCDTSGNIIGQSLPEQHDVDAMALTENRLIGDKKYVIRTDLLRSVAPMPVFAGERNFNPHYLVLKLSPSYRFLTDNTPYCIVDYQPDGMSANIFRQYVNSPNSFAEFRRLILTLPNVSFRYRLRTAVHYVSSCILAKKKRIISSSPRKLLVAVAYIPGFVISRYIKKKVKDKRQYD